MINISKIVLERFVTSLLLIAVFSFVRIIQISARIIDKLDVSLFSKRCDTLNFVNFFFKYFGYFKIRNTFFLIFWRWKLLDIFEYCERGINIQWNVAYSFDFGDIMIVI